MLEQKIEALTAAVEALTLAMTNQSAAPAPTPTVAPAPTPTVAPAPTPTVAPAMTLQEANAALVAELPRLGGQAVAVPKINAVLAAHGVTGLGGLPPEKLSAVVAEIKALV